MGGGVDRGPTSRLLAVRARIVVFAWLSARSSGNRRYGMGDDGTPGWREPCNHKGRQHPAARAGMGRVQVIRQIARTDGVARLALESSVRFHEADSTVAPQQAHSDPIGAVTKQQRPCGVAAEDR